MDDFCAMCEKLCVKKIWAVLQQCSTCLGARSVFVQNVHNKSLAKWLHAALLPDAKKFFAKNDHP